MREHGATLLRQDTLPVSAWRLPANCDLELRFERWPCDPSLKTSQCVSGTWMSILLLVLSPVLAPTVNQPIVSTRAPGIVDESSVAGRHSSNFVTVNDANSALWIVEKPCDFIHCERDSHHGSLRGSVYRKTRRPMFVFVLGALRNGGPECQLERIAPGARRAGCGLLVGAAGCADRPDSARPGAISAGRAQVT